MDIRHEVDGNSAPDIRPDRGISAQAEFPMPKCHGISAFRLPAIRPEPNSLAFRPFNSYTHLHTQPSSDNSF
jgi:hypothetical protein